MKFNSLSRAPHLPVSHNAAIKKQCLVGSGEVDRVTNFSRAVFPPGEIAPGHSHLDITEVFYIESGRGEMQIGDSIIALEPGCCITVEPGEVHELRNPGSKELIVLYFGIEH